MTAPEPFKVKSGTVFKDRLLSISGGWPVWTVAAAGAVMTACSCVDVRWLAVGLMLWICVAPCMAAFLYFIHIMSPGIVPNMLPHTLERSDGGYLLRTWRRADTEDTEVADEWIETGTVWLNDSHITDRKTTLEYEKLYFRDSRMTILYVPRY